MDYATSRFQTSRNNVLGSAQEMMSGAVQSTRECIASNPASSVFAAFAAGMGLGIGLALAMGRRTPPPLDVRLRDKIAQLVQDHIPWARS